MLLKKVEGVWEGGYGYQKGGTAIKKVGTEKG